MPPKRKRAEADVDTAQLTSSKGTRASARLATETTSSAAPPKANKTKKAKPPAKKSPVTKKAAAKAQKNIEEDENEDDPGYSEDDYQEKRATKNSATKNPVLENNPDSEEEEPPPKKKRTVKKVPKERTAVEPKLEKKIVTDHPSGDRGLDPKSYTLARVGNLFTSYADEDDPTIINGEGLEKLCEEAKIPMEGALPLLLAWQLDCKEMGKITLDEWTTGLKKLRIDTLHKLSLALSDLETILLSESPITLKPSKTHAYSKDKYIEYGSDRNAAFSQFYFYCFSIARSEQQRNIDIDTACALWSVVLPPRWPIALELIEFVTEKKDIYKGITKDVWGMTYEFCKTVKPSLENYNEEEAWPTILDEFYLWKKAKIEGADPQTE